MKDSQIKKLVKELSKHNIVNLIIKLRKELDKKDVDKETVDSLLGELEFRAKSQENYIEDRRKKLPGNYIGNYKDAGSMVVALYNADSVEKLLEFEKNVRKYEFSTVSLDHLKDVRKMLRDILDRIRNHQRLEREHLEYINLNMTPEYVIGVMLGPLITRSPVDSWEIALWQWIIQAFNGFETMPQKCRAEGCNNIYIPHPGGSKQKYCSGKCRIKEHRIQKL